MFFDFEFLEMQSLQKENMWGQYFFVISFNFYFR